MLILHLWPGVLLNGLNAGLAGNRIEDRSWFQSCSLKTEGAILTLKENWDLASHIARLGDNRVTTNG